MIEIEIIKEDSKKLELFIQQMKLIYKDKKKKKGKK